ncbi:hypothetical protein [Chiayiivirga flava]|uniref:Uncharacterized protein n=1 Tax=Chiayiivirga flava TaxID=659595 RepID=A0A7W8G3B7_9GAMM|nr:hypothetical protein [Chiayiivirga flava]MBB5209660.1 hypothetical protein [Chiayiivirga flava]
MWGRTGMLAVALALPAAGVRAADDDEAWVLRYMGAAMAPGVPVAAERARRVEFPELARLAGRRVRIEVADGSQRAGVVQQADADAVLLRVLRSTGQATVTLARADVRAVRVD